MSFELKQSLHRPLQHDHQYLNDSPSTLYQNKNVDDQKLFAKNDDSPLHYQDNTEKRKHSLSAQLIGQTYQSNYNNQAKQQNYVITQEVHLSGQRSGCLSHLFDGSLQANATKNFIRKVYMILSIQLAITAGFCFLSYYSQQLFNFQLNNFWLVYVCIGFMLVIQIIIFFFNFGRVFPCNMILLFAFTLFESYFLGCITSLIANMRGGTIVVIAACMTLAIVIVLSLYALLTRNDFTTGWGILLAILTPFVIFGIFAAISWIPILHNLYCALGAALFGIYLVIDTQLIAGGGRQSLSLDDYVAGALMLYIDIIQIFLYILSLFGSN